MADGSDQHYDRTHQLLDAARTAVSEIPIGPIGDEARKALGFIIEAVEHTTYGWGGMENPDPDLDHPEDDMSPAPKIPTVRSMLIQGSNCVSVLNEYAQKRGVDQPTYEFQGGPPFQCVCKVMDREVNSSGEHRTKNEAKHDSAEVMLSELR